MEKTNNTPWIRWSERKPKDGTNIIAILHPVYPDMKNSGFQIIHFGTAVVSLVGINAWENRLGDVYWLELPK